MPTEFERWLVAQKVPYCSLKYSRGYTMDGRLRDEAIRQFSFAILTDEVLKELESLGPFLEIGAGTGYWAYEIRKLGVEVIAVDLDPYHGLTAQEGHTSWGGVWKDTAKGILNKLKEKVADYTLLTVWPSYEESWPAASLKMFMNYGGKRVVYVGEGHGGCTANDRFHQLLERDWEKVKEVRIPTWQYIRDYLTVYRRK